MPALFSAATERYPAVSVSKAIIPAAGHGTRMLPVTRSVPKELLPVGSEPAIGWVVREAAAAGIRELAIVVSPDKPLIAGYLEASDLTRELGVSFSFVVQERQLGLADAIWRCREFAGHEPFGLLLPDNVMLSRPSGFETMVELAGRHGRDVIGALRLDSTHSRQYGLAGLIGYEELAGGVLEISSLSDKRAGRLEIAPGETTVRACGRYVCTPDVFEGIARLRSAGVPELDEVPVYQEIIRRRGALGYILPRGFFDVGYPLGFAAANAYWLEHFGRGL